MGALSSGEASTHPPSVRTVMTPAAQNKFADITVDVINYFAMMRFLF
jgi:hypothetical protein